jgi:glycosyltransferase involved in cell wall biosynthesis
MIYIVELEPVETRYTAQWKTHLPRQMREAGLEVKVIQGPSDAPQDTTPGAFLNFSGTNYWKSEQLKTISQMFANGEVQDGDYFLYTDAWNPTVLQLKYMSELLGVKVKIGGMWHAGSYDPADFLGRLIGDAPWVRLAEESMFNVFDHNFFATEFHIDLFMESFPNVDTTKIHRVGWPMEYLEHLLSEYNIPTSKNDIVLFPHRVAPEKQVEIFKDLGKEFKDVDFIVAQEQDLSKDEYHSLLMRSKIVFSANTQETLGISCFEGALVGATPMVPNRLSYTEMYDDKFKYPSEWTRDWGSYLKHKDRLVDKVKELLNFNWLMSDDNERLAENLKNDFFSGKALYEVIGEEHE